MTARLTLAHAAYTRFNAQSGITMGATVAALSHSAGVFSAIVDLFSAVMDLYAVLKHRLQILELNYTYGRYE